MDILDIARFWSKVDVQIAFRCWGWRGSVGTSGYGEFKVDGKCEQAHLVAFAMAVGEIPEGTVIRHQCDNPLCVNPTHLLSGTQADNVRDRVIRERSAKGEKSGRARLTDSQVIEIRGKSDVPLVELGRRYGVNRGTIEAIRYRRSWKHLP